MSLVAVACALWCSSASAQPSRVFLLLPEAPDPGLERVAEAFEARVLGAQAGALAFADSAEADASLSSCSESAQAQESVRLCRLRAARRLTVEHVLELALHTKAGRTQVALGAWDPVGNVKVFAALRDIESSPTTIDVATASLADEYLCFRGVVERCDAELAQPNPGTVGRGRLEVRDVGPINAGRVEVWLDERRIGLAPATLLGLPEGGANLQLRADGFIWHEQHVELAAGVDVVVDGVVLQRLPCDRGEVAPCQELCEQGNVHGCLRLSELEATRHGELYDPTSAAARFQQLCDAGEHEGCVGLGRVALQERGLAGVEEAVRAFEQACDAGHARGCYQLGLVAYRVHRAPSRGANLLSRACDAGVARACKDLADAYSDGWYFDGGSPDAPPSATSDAQARRFGLSLGPWGADRWDGWKEGERGLRQPARAFGYYEKGCELGLGEACWEVAMNYHLGAGVMKDRDRLDAYKAKALRLYEQECELGIPRPCWSCGEQPEARYREGPQAAFGRAEALWKSACERGDGSACLWYALVLRQVGTSESADTAREVVAMVCEDEDTYGEVARGSACYSLGARYDDGDGVLASPERARHYYQRSCVLGESLGCYAFEHSGGCASCAVRAKADSEPLAALFSALVAFLLLTTRRRAVHPRRRESEGAP